MYKRLYTFLIGLSVATVAGSGVANASLICATGTCTSEASFSLTTLSFGSPQSLVFDQFDSTLGTLNSVTLTFETTGTQDTSLHTEIVTSGYLQNQGGLAFSLGVGVTGSLALLVDPDFSSISFSINAAAFAYPTKNGILAAYGSTPFANTCTSPYNSCTPESGGVSHDTVSWQNLTALLNGSGGTTSGVFTQTLNCPSCDTSRFSAPGGGTFTIDNIFGSAGYDAQLPGTYDLKSFSGATAVADITYNYTPATSTPEPATLGLMGSALIGLGVLSKKLRKQ